MRKVRVIIYIILLQILNCLVAKAQSNLEKALQQLNIFPGQYENTLVVEKVLPYSPNESVLVIPKISEDDAYKVFDSYILIINNITGNIIKKSVKHSAWVSDAIELRRIEIDTAPYLIAKGKRAFGIRVFYEGGTSQNPYSGETLSLYASNGELLSTVLEDFSIGSFTGEWTMSCSSHYTREQKTIAIAKNKTNYYFDLIVKNKRTLITEFQNDEDCEENQKVEVENQVLKYKNGQYK